MKLLLFHICMFNFLACMKKLITLNYYHHSNILYFLKNQCKNTNKPNSEFSYVEFDSVIIRDDKHPINDIKQKNTENILTNVYIESLNVINLNTITDNNLENDNNKFTINFNYINDKYQKEEKENFKEENSLNKQDFLNKYIFVDENEDDGKYCIVELYLEENDTVIWKKLLYLSESNKRDYKYLYLPLYN